MSLINSLEPKLGHWAIPSLLRITAVLQLGVFLLGKQTPEFTERLTLVPALVFKGEVWRLRNSGKLGDEIRAAQGYAAAVAYPDAPPDAWRWHGIMLLKSGRQQDAKAAFARYLQLAPNAPDAALVRQMMIS